MPNAEIIAPTTTFDLSQINDPEERFTLWRESISVVFEVELKQGRPSEAFTAEVTCSHLSALLFNTAKSESQFFNRPPGLIAQDNLDHCLLQMYLQGSTSGQWGKHRNSTVQAGDIFFLDLTQPFASLATDFFNITLVIPRHIMQQHLPAVEKYHGSILPHDSIYAKLLGAHLLSIHADLPKLSAGEAATVAEGVAHLAGLYFRQACPPNDCPQINTTLRSSIRNYIAANLTNPSLTPDSIAVHFNMSRAHLYRLFSAEQSVAGFILEQRLYRAYRELGLAGYRQRRIGEIAFSLGFNSESNFTRCFHKFFGLTPTEARNKLCQPSHSHTGHHAELDRRYEDWVRQL